MFYVDINENRTIVFTYKNDTITPVFKNKKIRRANLIINVPALVRFTTYPAIKNKKYFDSMVKNSLNEHFPVNLSEYTVDYRVLNNGQTLLVAAKTELIEHYIERAKTVITGSIQSIDLYQNFVGKHISKKEQGNILVVTRQKDSAILQFISNTEPTAITDCDYTNLERTFSPYISLDGSTTIERAYLQKTLQNTLATYLDNLGVNIQTFEEVADLP